MSKEWNRTEIKALLDRNDKAVCRAVLAIFNRQTEEEKFGERTISRNGVGFNGVDSQILSSFAKFYHDKGFLSPKQIQIARKKIYKYVGQLEEIVKERGEQ